MNEPCSTCKVSMLRSVARLLAVSGYNVTLEDHRGNTAQHLTQNSPARGQVVLRYTGGRWRRRVRLAAAQVRADQPDAAEHVASALRVAGLRAVTISADF